MRWASLFCHEPRILGNKTWHLLILSVPDTLCTLFIILQPPCKVAIPILQLRKLRLRDSKGLVWMTKLGSEPNSAWFQGPYFVHYFLVPPSIAEWREGFLGPSFLICKTWELDSMITEVCFTFNILYWYFRAFCYRDYDSFLGKTHFECFQIPQILAEIFKQDVDRYT